jgi:parallel beta-helix repeat protein
MPYTYTTNWQLKKPTVLTLALIGDLNDNADSIEEALSFLYNVQSPRFGAVGDAATDDTSAIAAAIAAAGANNTVYFPNGTYLVSGLTANQSSQKWLLEPGAIIRLKDSANTHVVTVTADDVQIIGGQIDGNQANNTGTLSGIRASSRSRLRIEGVRFASVETHGVYFTSCTDCDVVDCRFTAMPYFVMLQYANTNIRVSGCHGSGATSNGLLADGGAGVYADKNGSNTNYRIHVADCWFTGGRGIYLNNSTDSTVVGCTCEGSDDVGIDLEMCDRVTVSGCTVRSNTNYGIALLQGCSFCTVTGCVSRGNTGRGIQVSAYTGDTTARAVGNAVVGNVAEGNGGAGIILLGATYTTVSGNLCMNNGTTVASQGGIHLTNVGAVYSTNNVVQGNVCTDNQGSKTQAYGIICVNASDTLNTIVDNEVGGNLTSPISESGVTNVRRSNRGSTDAVSARAYNSGAVSTANTTWTAVTLNSERWDTRSLHSTSSNTERLTAPVAGHYEGKAYVAFAASAGGTARQVRIRLNGTTTIAQASAPPLGAGNAVFVIVPFSYQLAAADYVHAEAWQDSGGALDVAVSGNVSPELGMTLVEQS